MFKNEGLLTVQMLTRHWVFTNAFGKKTEIKGPGALGANPILKPGETHTYKSGTWLSTSFGSMHGSFQFEVLRQGGTFAGWVSGPPVGAKFNAPVDRLGLVNEATLRVGVEIHDKNKAIKSIQAPCPVDAGSETGTEEDWWARLDDNIPCTSVFSTHRIIIGATVSFISLTDQGESKERRFKYDVQINNARTEAVTIHAYHWRFFLKGEGPVFIANGVGFGGDQNIGKRDVKGGDAFRFLGHFLFPQQEMDPPSLLEAFEVLQSGSQKIKVPVDELHAEGLFIFLIGVMADMPPISLSISRAS